MLIKQILTFFIANNFFVCFDSEHTNQGFKFIYSNMALASQLLFQVETMEIWFVMHDLRIDPKFINYLRPLVNIDLAQLISKSSLTLLDLRNVKFWVKKSMRYL